MMEASTSKDGGWRAVLERFEQHSPASVMARAALEQALPADWIDEVFDTHRRYQYARELLFSTIVEAMTLVALGLRSSLHAAARQMETLPVSLTALYNKINRTEPEILEALVRGSAQSLAPAMTGLGQGAVLPGWAVRVLDGNHFPGTEKRIAPLRGQAGRPQKRASMRGIVVGAVLSFVLWTTLAWAAVCTYTWLDVGRFSASAGSLISSLMCINLAVVLTTIWLAFVCEDEQDATEFWPVQLD